MGLIDNSVEYGEEGEEEQDESDEDEDAAKR